jgi:hypothetical protein
VAEGAPLLREYGGKTLSRVRIPPSPPVFRNSRVFFISSPKISVINQEIDYEKKYPKNDSSFIDTL